MNERRIRNQKGAAVTGLVLALFMFIMLIGFFAFDSSRLQMAQRELTATCDAASLAGTAMLTSAPIDNDDATASKLRAAQTQACGYATNMFRAGNMLGRSLASATVVTPLSAVGVVGAPASCNVMIALADPLNQYVGVAPTFPDCINGRAIMCYAGYTYQPVFLGIVGIQKVGLNAASGGGLPQVDAVLVFDNSGSMDDATNVTFVRRTWDSTVLKTGGANITNYSNNVAAPMAPLNSGQAQDSAHGVVHYIEVPPPSATSHRLSDYLNHNYTNNPNGLILNVLPPMSLATADNTDSQVGNKYVLDKNLRVNTLPFAGVGVTGPISNGPVPSKWQRDFGTPPGNCTLAQGNGNAYGGYGSYWNESLPGMRVNDGSINGNAAYDTNRVTFKPAEHPATTSGVITYQAQVNTGADAHVFTDLVVNIANPGGWPYTQPLNGPQSFVDTGDITFPSQEPDSLLAGQTFRFENLGVLVEAARGNLDSATNFNDALLDRGSVYTTIFPAASKVSTALTSGHCAANYQRAYQRLAMLYSQPIATAMDGANGGFFQKINSLTDCRFGFVGFSNAAQAMSSPSGPNFQTNGSAHGTASDSNNSYYIDASFAGAPNRNIRCMFTSQVTAGPENNTAIAGGAGSGFRQPRRVLRKADTQAVSFGAVVGGMSSVTLNGAYNAPWSALSSNTQANGLENGRPLDQTDTAEALTTARAMFHNGTNYDIATLSNNRPAGKHAIVFFTDGIPTGGIASTEATQSLTVAQACKNDGIAVFTIGLDVTGNPVLQAQQPVFLGNSSTGLAGAGGNGGKFFPCASAGTVKDAFSAVARRLTQGQR